MRWALLLAVVLGVAGCGNDDGGGGQVGVIRLAVNPWTGSAVDAAVAKILLEEEVGIAVELNEVDEFTQWERIAEGDLHACLEVWPSGHAADIETYIVEQSAVADGGRLGVVGKIGWYVPTYLVTMHPELATWEGLQDPSIISLLRTSETGSRGQFLAGDPSWVQYDQQIIDNLALDLQVVFAGSEQELLARLDAAYSAQQPLLFYFFKPHSAHSRYDLTEVSLPAHTEACYARAATGGIDCDYPTDLLFKIFWPGLESASPRAYELLRRFQYSTEEQTELIALVDSGMTPDAAARVWLAENEEIWRDWIPAR
jgi:glycine betaine/proline transport system substrate-binding protein